MRIKYIYIIFASANGNKNIIKTAKTMKTTTTNRMKEYWLESTNGQGYFQETKKEFYKALRAGFRGFIKYESGMEIWINDSK